MDLILLLNLLILSPLGGVVALDFFTSSGLTSDAEGAASVLFSPVGEFTLVGSVSPSQDSGEGETDSTPWGHLYWISTEISANALFTRR